MRAVKDSLATPFRNRKGVSERGRPIDRGKTLVGGAQWEINRPPALGNESLRSFGEKERGSGWSSRGLFLLDVRSET